MILLGFSLVLLQAICIHVYQSDNGFSARFQNTIASSASETIDPLLGVSALGVHTTSDIFSCWHESYLVYCEYSLRFDPQLLTLNHCSFDLKKQESFNR